MMRRMKLFSRINLLGWFDNMPIQTMGKQGDFSLILITFNAFQELNAVYNLNLEKDIGQAHLLQVRH